MDAEILAAASALVHRSDFVFLSTLDGHPEIRVLFNLMKLRAEAVASGPAALGNPFAAWLATNTSSHKMGQIRRDPRACLYYADTAAFEGLSLQGELEEVLDAEIRRTLWTDAWTMYYPGGLDGGDFTLLRFRPAGGRYYHGLRVVAFDASAGARA